MHIPYRVKRPLRTTEYAFDFYLPLCDNSAIRSTVSEDDSVDGYARCSCRCRFPHIVPDWRRAMPHPTSSGPRPAGGLLVRGSKNDDGSTTNLPIQRPGGPGTPEARAHPERDQPTC